MYGTLACEITSTSPVSSSALFAMEKLKQKEISRLFYEMKF